MLKEPLRSSVYLGYFQDKHTPFGLVCDNLSLIICQAFLIALHLSAPSYLQLIFATPLLPCFPTWPSDGAIVLKSDVLYTLHAKGGRASSGRCREVGKGRKAATKFIISSCLWCRKVKSRTWCK